MSSRLCDELLDLVMSHLATNANGGLRNGEFRALVSCNRLSRQFYRVTLPYLYRSIHTVGDRSLEALLRTLEDDDRLQRSSVLQHTTASVCTTLFADDNSVTRFPDSNRHRFRSVQDHAAMTRSTNRTFCTLFRLLPNLERLDVSQPNHQPLFVGESVELPWLSCFTRYVDNPHLSLPHLTRIDAAVYGISVNDLYPVFKLPTMRTLNFYGGDMASSQRALNTPGRVAQYLTDWSFQNNNIKHLAFYGLEPPSDLWSMSLVGETCRHLETLTMIAHSHKTWGANMFSNTLASFHRAVQNPAFVRLTAFDEKTTRTDRWLMQAATQWIRILFSLTPALELTFDHEVIRHLPDPTTQAIAWPPNIKVLTLRSTTIYEERKDSKLLRLLLRISGELQSGELASLERLVVELTVFDKYDVGLLDLIISQFAITHVELILRDKTGCAWGVQRMLCEARLRLGR